MSRTLLTAVSLWLFTGVAAGGPVTITEVLYDAVGGDQGGTFVELYGPPGLSLVGYELEGVNGRGGGITHSVWLGEFLIPEDGFLVLADLDSTGVTRVVNFDYGIANLDFQNGPDSVRLMFGSTVADGLGYGDFGGGLVFAGEGLPAPDAPSGSSLARWSAGVDTDQNSLDFKVDETPTPGYQDAGPTAVPTPEPSSLVLMLCGLVALLGEIRRYRMKQ